MELNLILFSTDLAFGRQFEASSTCGQSGAEEYCYSENDGVLVPDDCYVCDASSPLLSRGVANLNDDESGDQLQSGDDNLTDDESAERTWWQSGDRVNEVTIELMLEQESELFRIKVDFRSLRPASAVLETSTDFGTSYKPMQHYSDKCLEDFGVADEALEDGEAGCTSNYTDPSPGPVSPPPFLYMDRYVLHMCTILL